MARFNGRAAAGLGAAVLICAGSAAGAETPAQFYAGKTVKLYVSAVAGGGYDNIARKFIAHYAKKVPGSPNMIVVNMLGGGGIVMVNWAYNVAPKDGTVIGMPNLTVATNQVIAPKALKYDVTKLNWIGNLEQQTMSIFTWHTSQTKTIQDAMKRPTPMAASTKGSVLQQIMALSNHIIGTKFQIALGYSTTRVLAVERGEVEGSASSLQNFAVLAPHWLEDGGRKLNILVVNTEKRLSSHPKVPTMLELTKNDEHKEMLRFMMRQSLTGRSIFAPPGVPADRIEALRRAFDATVKDTEFMADMKRIKVQVEPNTGEEIQDVVKRVVETSPKVAGQIMKVIE